MRSVIAGISPDGWRSHTLHDASRDWQETNCYVDLWTEVLHAKGLAPEAMLGFCVTQDFEGDQFTFFKVPLEDLETLYDIRVGELSIYDSVERHVVEQIGQGRMALVEVDAFHLPDTRGISYRLEHSKTTIGINVLDPDARRLHYFHNAGFFALEGDDFDGVFQRNNPPGPQNANLFPYVEFARFGTAPLQGVALRDAALALLLRHLKRAPRANPISAFARRIESQAQAIKARDPAFFHKYAFNTLRQLGANFELLSSHLDWLTAQDVDGLTAAAGAARELSTAAKAYQFQLARAVTRGKTEALIGQLDGMTARWDHLFDHLDRRSRDVMTLLLQADQELKLHWVVQAEGTTALAASVPGTVAQALQAAGELDLLNPPDLESLDWWFTASVIGTGAHELLLDGIACAYDIYLDEKPLVSCESMYAAHRVNLTLSGEHRLAICCRAMAGRYERGGKRARWRPKLVAPQGLRFFRKSFLGHVGGWCPSLKPVGPFRDVRLIPSDAILGDVTLTTRCEGEDGVLDVRIETRARTAKVSCGSTTTTLAMSEPGVLTGTLRLSHVDRWWPHTHGTPVLHEVRARIGETDVSLGRVGFRTLDVDRDVDGDGFGLRVNGVPVFCRGALWTNADLVSLPGTRDAYAPLLTLARDAGMNMLRIGGTMTYETRAFFDFADELGLLVWQDFMLANLDYPAADAAFAQTIAQEARQVLASIGAAPSLAILCGGSEVAQQAAMMGLPQAAWSNELFDTILPQVCAQARPDVPYVPNTPNGGALPFEPRRGVCHYYGVSAYMRPIEDARHAGVRFAAECLGFANVPDGPVPLARDSGEIVHPLWGERYERDVGATWFFEEVRNHYLREVYGFDPLALCRDDPERYLDFSRAVNAELAESVFALWRRHGSPTRGGLVWFLRDLYPGASFGVLDSANQPKAIWHGLARAFRPVQVLLVDEGLNGLDVHLINETAAAVDATLSMTCLRDGAIRVMQAQRAVTLAPRSSQRLAATELWGAFFDTAYTYRFGPPSHDVTVATLNDADGAVISEAFHFPLGRGHVCHDLGLTAEIRRDGDDWWLSLTTQRFAQSLHIDDAQWRGAQDWFHLPPGQERRVRLIPRAPGATSPSGHLRALNGISPVTFGVSG